MKRSSVAQSFELFVTNRTRFYSHSLMYRTHSISTPKKNCLPFSALSLYLDPLALFGQSAWFGHPALLSTIWKYWQSLIHSFQLYFLRGDPHYTHSRADSTIVYHRITNGCLDHQYYNQVHTPIPRFHSFKHFKHPMTDKIYIQLDRTKISLPSSITTQTSDKYRTAVENEHKLLDW